MTDIIPNQLVPGGVMKQLGDAAGGVTYNQYVAGGCMGQLYDAAGVDIPLDQYAPGGPMKQIETAIEEGGGVDPVGVIDLENGVYTWGGVTKSLGDLFGTEGPWIYNATQHTANGYEGEAFAAILGDAKAALIDPAGVVMVLDCTVEAGTVAMELHRAPGFATDGIYQQGSVNSAINDGNGGGSVNTASGAAGRGKAAFLISTALQQVSDNGGTVATCDPPIQRELEPNRAAITVNTGAILHAITFYPADTDLQVVSSEV
jgi:hypothetical protein